MLGYFSLNHPVFHYYTACVHDMCLCSMVKSNTSCLDSVIKSSRYITIHQGQLSLSSLRGR